MKALTFIVTDRCNITCDFCAPGCGPHYKGGLSSKIMIYVFDRLSELGYVPVVVFTGGEPFLFKGNIEKTLRHISSISETPSRIVTNAYWATSLKKAKKELKTLKEAGLTELNYSVDDFHQKYIPEANIVYGVEAAIELKIPVLLAHKTYNGSKTSKQYYERLIGRKIPDFNDLIREKKEIPLLSITTGYTLPIGRGSDKINKDKWGPEKIYENNWKGPCQEILKSIQISPDGQLSPCCGLVDRSIGVFYAGSVIDNDIFDILEKANGSVIYNWLALAGPSGIMDFIKTQDSSLPFLDNYVQNCQLCQEIFSDRRKTDIVLKGLKQLAKPLSIYRCLFEAQRRAHVEKYTIANAK